ncbi:uncharacterized protein LOC113160323 isoform X2 [Anabas testudineus]|uniref:uncharacterized protein LOC113160323 isoform X2 n=1 Tax=Anabas testudineus TaxID=64144 RepID=UPI000E45DE15|nr:uncharacterized protein LOC113160323 isoform X2 [Anabas testudineus]
MQKRKNRREYNEHFVEGQHLKLDDLKEEAQDLENQYLFRENIPSYPRPEFHVSHLKHDTNQVGLKGIRRDGGFRARDPLRAQDSRRQTPLLWWSLSVRPDDVTAAETGLLEKTFPDRSQEQVQRQQSFLGRFATSPAFMKSSRLGSYRFTFPLEEVLEAYSEQFCSGAQPVLRVYETVLYKQEVMYSVLVHSPANQELFLKYPLLTDDPNAVCAFKDGRFIWRPEAMCETHSYELIEKRDENQMDVRQLFGSDCEYYVWDHVVVALHLEEEQVLEFDRDKLRENLKFCDKGPATITRYNFDGFKEAETLVKELWPDDPASLEKEMSLQELLAEQH